MMQKRTDVENTLSLSSFQNPGDGLEIGGWGEMEMDEGTLWGFWLEMSLVVPFTKTGKLREERVGRGSRYFVLPT